MPPSTLRRAIAGLTRVELAFALADWPTAARDDQLPPDVRAVARDWTLWLVMGGRGAGKTRTGAEWVKAQAAGAPPLAAARAGRIALVGPTYHEARAVMVEGVSGLIAVCGEDRPRFEKTRRRLVWANGAEAQLDSGEDPEALRGPQFDCAWCDELAKWRYPEETYDMLQFGLRLGAHPRLVVTTTPRPLKLLRTLSEAPGVVVDRAPTALNRHNLSPAFLARIEDRYGGTRLGRQELAGELIDDDPGALFRRAWIEAGRGRAPDDLERIVVAVDPPASARRGADRCGIVCAGIDAGGVIWVLDDATVEAASPARWARTAVNLYHARKADRIVAEANQGGDMVEAVVRQVEASVPLRLVHASRGKRARAEPVAALYEQGRVRHAGAFPDLEDEMCALDRSGLAAGRSPDRVDALVWAASELALTPRARPRVRGLA